MGAHNINVASLNTKSHDLPNMAIDVSAAVCTAADTSIAIFGRSCDTQDSIYTDNYP
jgi:hypothetical protein